MADLDGLKVAITKSDLNQMSQQLQMGKPPLCPMDNPTLRNLQKIMEKKEKLPRCVKGGPVPDIGNPGSRCACHQLSDARHKGG